MVAITNATTNQGQGIKRQGGQGVVLDLHLKGDGIWNAIYTVDIAVGTPQVTFPIFVDTGSSDFWIASTSCGTSECKQSGQTLWNPEGSSTHLASDANFQLPYLMGSVKGPVYWDTITIGGYQIPDQAIAAATEVANEPLNAGFSGLIGLALPRNSVIAQLLPPGTTDAPDGASVIANLFGQPTAPTNRFFAISLSRPGFDNRDISWHAWPSKLALGTPIPEVVNALAALHANSSSTTTRRTRSNLSPTHTVRQIDGSINNPSQLAWAQILPAPSGYLHWRTQISEIIVTDEQGIEKSIALGRSLVDNGQSSLWPVAVLDTGGSSILMRSDLANGLYGAIGIGPASDGMYYIPCQTPFTISITIGQIRLPLHPLDMSLPPSNDPSSTSCVGAIQANPSVDQGKLPGDIILGVPFLRNVYVVHDLGSEDGTDRKPRFGVASLTNSTLAATEFQNVRVRNLNPDGSSNGKTPEQPTGDGMKTALKIGIGVLCFVVVCGMLFGMLRCSMRRRLRQEQRLAKKLDHARLGSGSNSYRVLLLVDEGTDKHVKTQDKRGFFERLFARNGYRRAGNGEATELTEDELRMRRFEEYKRRQAQEERDSMWSQSTRVRDTLVGGDHGFGHKVGWTVDEFGSPLDPLDEQRGRQIKDATCSSGSARSRTLSPEPVSAERTLMRHRSPSREQSNVDVSHATFTPLNQPVRTLGNTRASLAVQPNLSPLTEAADSQIVTPVSTAHQLSTLSHPDVRRSASSYERVDVEDAPNPHFNPYAIPIGSAVLPTHESATPSATSIAQLFPATPSDTLRGPRPLLPSRNPYQKSSPPTSTSPELRAPSTTVDKSGSPSTAPPPDPIVAPSGYDLAGPPGLSPCMGTHIDPSQRTPIPSAPWPWGFPPPTLSPSAPISFQPPISHSVQPVAHPLAHGPLPPGAAPPMTRQQSIELNTPTNPPSPGFNTPLLSSRALSIPPPPPIVTRTPTINAATQTREDPPPPPLPPLSPEESIGQLAMVPVGSNSVTPVTSPPSSSTFPEDGHSADLPVQRW